MDPGSIIGLVTTVAGIASKGITTLQKLKLTYDNADLTVTLLIGQLHSIKAAIEQIRKWTSSRLVYEPQHNQLVLDIKTSIDSCIVITLALNKHLESLTYDSNGLTGRGKAKYAWEERSIADFTTLLNNQVNALQLLIAAVQCQTAFESHALLLKEENRRTLKRVEDDSSSLVQSSETFDRPASIHSIEHEVSEKFLENNTLSQLDSNILDSRVYRKAIKSAIKNVAKNIEPIPTSTTEPTIFFTEAFERLKRSELGHSSRQQSAANTQKESEVYHDSSDAFILRRQSISLEREPLLAKTPNIQNIFQRMPAPRFVKELFFRRVSSNNSNSSDNSDNSDQSNNPNNVLILGTSSSGKTTLLKSLSAYAHTFSSGQQQLPRATPEDLVLSAIESMNIVLRNMEETDVRFTDSTSELSYLQFIEISESPGVLDQSHAISRAIQQLWADHSVKMHVWYASLPELESNAEYLFDNIERICVARDIGNSPGALSDEDLLQHRVRTTGIHRLSLNFGDCAFNFFDVGGWRSERKKWIHIFEEAGAVVLMADVTSYDRKLGEDGKSGCLDDDINLWDAILSSRWFNETPMICIFTKMDILRRKMEISAFKDNLPRFDNFKGDSSNIEDIQQYLQNVMIPRRCESKVLYTSFCSFFDGPDPDPAQQIVLHLKKLFETK